MKKIITLLILFVGMVSTVSATSTTIYYAVPSTVVKDVSKSVELQMKYGKGDSEWFSPRAAMTKTNKTYYGNYIYYCEVDLPYGGYYNMEFWYNGNKVKDVYAGDWNTDLHDGEMYDHNAGWRKYNYDKTVTIHALKKDGWSKVYICDEFNDYGEHWDTEETFPGTEGTQSTINGNWYDYTVTGRPCTRVVTSNGWDGAGNRSGNCAIGDAKEYWISYDGSTTSCVSEVPASFSYSRDVTPSNFGTICLPYAAEVTGATIYEISSAIKNGSGDLTGINLTEISELTAGVAYIFKATGSTLTATLSGNYTNATAGNYMVGNLSSANLNVPLGKYVVSGNKIRKVVSGGSGVTVGQYRGYLDLSTLEATSARGLNFISLEGETTGIDAVKQEVKANEVFFNLAGQRVAQPAKGLYIVNGKKVIMK